MSSFLTRRTDCARVKRRRRAPYRCPAPSDASRRQTGRRSAMVFPSMNTQMRTDEVRAAADTDEVRLRAAGFRWGNKGTHTSRTIMLDELRAVLTSCRHDATRHEYLAAIQQENCLGKRTAATRKL